MELMKKVLLVDDDPIIVATYSRKLQAAGFVVEGAHDGDEGLFALKRFKPDVVLLDLQMPRINGIEWLREVRCYPKLRKLPVVIFSAGTLEWQMKAARDSDAMFVLSKTTKPEMVIEAVSAAATAGQWPV